ncbi:hypothetical protein UT300005_08660 [Clostridium sp. CTA-5]
MAQNSNYKNDYSTNNKTNTNDTDNNANAGNNNQNMSEDDINSLNLLEIARCIQIVNIYADILGYISIMEGFELIYNKYNNNSNSEDLPNPDFLSLEAVTLGVITRLIATQIGFIRYDDLYRKSTNGEITFSLQPNIDINIGNVIGILSSYYILKGVKGVYDRNSNQPIFEV